MLWTIAYKEVSGAAVTDADVPLAADSTMPIDSSNHPLLPTELQDVWWWAGGATTSRVRRSPPSFRAVQRAMIRPVEQAANPSARPLIMESWRTPLHYKKTEPLQILLTNGAAETDYVVATLGDGNFNIMQGDMYTCRYTSVGAAVANAWTALTSIAFDDVLPPGNYQIVGFDKFAAGGIAARVIFLGTPGPGAIPNIRPGILVPVANGSENFRYYRYGYLGPFGQFPNTALPTVEVLFTAATATPEGYFDLVKF